MLLSPCFQIIVRISIISTFSETIIYNKTILFQYFARSNTIKLINEWIIKCDSNRKFQIFSSWWNKNAQKAFFSKWTFINRKNHKTWTESNTISYAYCPLLLVVAIVFPPAFDSASSSDFVDCTSLLPPFCSLHWKLLWPILPQLKHSKIQKTLFISEAFETTYHTTYLVYHGYFSPAMTTHWLSDVQFGQQALSQTANELLQTSTLKRQKYSSFTSTFTVN